MANYSLNRTVFKKEAYENAIDTSFAQVSTPPIPLEDTISIEEFFNLYDILFYDIPTTGEVNSHTYIAQTSGDYVNFDQINNEVQALLDEITELRKQNLDLNQQVINLQISASTPNTQTTP
jgi:hypothetical protein